MKALNPEKILKLHNTNELLDQKYGQRGTHIRDAFEEKALSRYYVEMVRDRRKELKITQQQLADRIGKERSYIAHIERGETDIQLSSFLKISNALELNFSLYPIK